MIIFSVVFVVRIRRNARWFFMTPDALDQFNGLISQRPMIQSRSDGSLAQAPMASSLLIRYSMVNFFFRNHEADQHPSSLGSCRARWWSVSETSTPARRFTPVESIPIDLPDPSRRPATPGLPAQSKTSSLGPLKRGEVQYAIFSGPTARPADMDRVTRSMVVRASPASPARARSGELFSSSAAAFIVGVVSVDPA